MSEIFKYKYDDLFNPTLQALNILGGSGSVREIEEQVSEILKLSEDEINDIHRESTTKLTYRLAWARNYLKRYGLIENSSKGVWALTGKGKATPFVDKQQVKKAVVKLDKKERQDNNKPPSTDIENSSEELLEFSWQEELLDSVKKITPDKFERLCQRLLRELGFLNVEVTQRSNDGGIDGQGLIRLGGVLSFHVVFQAKRYQGSVGSNVVRDFRGAMIGRADKGLILTTGSFTREAKKEANRDGAPPIDLIDGNEFAEKLKELRLGVEVELVEKVKIKKEWFANF
ncbi:restriction system protein [Pontibacter aydingkolensis]|uniref:Restriction endonuclease n=1 Tax=Pontibacter aydingkolensis TaxID=1911536 RepID=A0ABS7CPT7_9BACT|nr:restriction endonuclease [Pontibacter aydingkolensis]MBW7465835.1 restriction endonuclease [Pontibacter aydingkolensis]